MQVFRRRAKLRGQEHGVAQTPGGNASPACGPSGRGGCAPAPGCPLRRWSAGLATRPETPLGHSAVLQGLGAEEALSTAQSVACTRAPSVHTRSLPRVSPRLERSRLASAAARARRPCFPGAALWVSRSASPRVGTHATGSRESVVTSARKVQSRIVQIRP